jgi:hypothetical protein
VLGLTASQKWFLLQFRRTDRITTGFTIHRKDLFLKYTMMKSKRTNFLGGLLNFEIFTGNLYCHVLEELAGSASRKLIGRITGVKCTIFISCYPLRAEPLIKGISNGFRRAGPACS